MTIQTLFPTDANRFHASHKITIKYTDLIPLGAVATNVLAITPILPIGFEVGGCGANLVVPFVFSDVGITSCLLTVGDVGDPDRYLTNTEIGVAGTEVLYAVTGVATQPYAPVTAAVVNATFVVAGGTPTLAEATAGELEILISLIDRRPSTLPKGPL